MEPGGPDLGSEHALHVDPNIELHSGPAPAVVPVRGVDDPPAPPGRTAPRRRSDQRSVPREAIGSFGWSAHGRVARVSGPDALVRLARCCALPAGADDQAEVPCGSATARQVVRAGVDSTIRPAPDGAEPRSPRVRALPPHVERDEPARNPNCSAACSADTELVGIPTRRPIASAISGRRRPRRPPRAAPAPRCALDAEANEAGGVVT